MPGDKSISHRALMFGALASGTTFVSGLLDSEDVRRTARALIQMGVVVKPPVAAGGVWQVQGMDHSQRKWKSPRTVMDMGNSGTSARLLMGLIGGKPVSATLTGDKSLSKRPMGRVIKPLAQMGVRFDTGQGDTLPLRVTGSMQLRPITYEMPVASAQVKSAILLAGLSAKGKTTVIEPLPTRDHTERMLRAFGGEVSADPRDDGRLAVTITGGQHLTGRSVSVPTDPSSAAFPVVAALMTPESEIMIPNVLVNPTRIGLYQTLIDMGADISFENQREKSGEPVADLRVRSSKLHGVRVPADRAPSMIDEFPVLAVAAACASGETVMEGLAELRVKESNRLQAIADGLTACGASVEVSGDNLVVNGTGHPPDGGAMIKTSLDHRIAMSFLVLGMVTPRAVKIDDAAAIATSFPNFIKLMNGLGAQIQVVD